MTRIARVFARHNQMADIAGPDAAPRRLRLHRRFRDLACGDLVELDATGDEVTRQLDRNNVLVRRDGFGRRKVIAANIDCVWIVIAPEPAPSRNLIDRFLVAILNLPARPRLLINKQDEGPAARPEWLDAYRQLDLDPLFVSAKSGFGLDDLAAAAAGQTNILVGSPVSESPRWSPRCSSSTGSSTRSRQPRATWPPPARDATPRSPPSGFHWPTAAPGLTRPACAISRPKSRPWTPWSAASRTSRSAVINAASVTAATRASPVVRYPKLLE